MSKSFSDLKSLTPRHRRLRNVLAWAATIVLPCLSAAITVHFGALHNIPGALLLASIALVAWFGYVGPAAVSIGLSWMLRDYFLVPFGRWTRSEELVRGIAFYLASALIAFLIIGLRRKYLRLVDECLEADRQHTVLLERARAAETELREITALQADQVKALSLAQQAGKSAAWILDTRVEQVKWLPGGFEIFGMPFAEFEGKRAPISMVEPEDQPGIRAALEKTLTTGVPFQPEFRLRWPNGEMHWQEARGVLDPEQPHLIRGTTFDITERKLAELNLLRVEKLAAVGRIASTIAHEINNPLASVTNLLYLALCDAALPGPVRAYLETAQQELSRLSNVTRLTLSYARPQSVAKRVDPAELVDSVLFLFRVRLESKCVRVERVACAPLSIHLFVDDLQRILTNLVANAIDAVAPSDGVLRITLARDGAQALLAIEDNGCGIPDDRASRIFEAFYTTKEEVGTGIGLWVTKELAEKNGGSIALINGGLKDDMRTRFELRFPLIDPA